MVQTQLLCTFIHTDALSDTIKEIQQNYTLAFNNVYVLENVEDDTQLVLTYNIILGSLKAGGRVPASTISVHRKKQTNTIYTINALNALIAEKNNGKVDKAFRVNWDELQNTVLVTAQGNLKIIKTKINTIINL